jgi:hypothetical protein
MKTFLAILAAVAVSASAAYAKCGKKVNAEGELTSYDADTKALVVMVGEKEVTLTATPTTKFKGTDGKDIAAAELVGKKVKVVSEHKKVDSVTAS